MRRVSLPLLLGLFACRPRAPSTEPIHDTSATNTPARPAPRDDRVAEIAAGHEITCARMFDGSVRCWGQYFGAPEEESFHKRTSLPTPRPDLGLATRIAVIGDIACVWGQDGRMRCRGAARRVVPAAFVNDALADVVEVSGAGGSYCLRRGDGVSRCVGNNHHGQLGPESVLDRVEEFVTPHELGPVAQIACGGEHTCARMPDGTARCWGEDDRGRDGFGLSGVLHPSVLFEAEALVDLAAGALLTCAIRDDTSLRCWSHLRIDNTSGERHRLQPVLGVTGAVDVGIGDAHACVLLQDGSVRCWGSDEFGQLGDGVDADAPRHWCRSFEKESEHCRSTPVTVADLHDAVAIAVGSDHTCALTRTHAVRCWGRNDGRLGDGSDEDRHAPVEPLWGP